MSKYTNHVYAGEILVTREIDGVTYTATVMPDEDSTPEDAGGNAKYAASWRRDEWCYFEIVISGERDGWTNDYMESIIGMDCAEREYYVETANELIADAAAGEEATINSENKTVQCPDTGTDHDMVLQIQEILSGQEWTADTPGEIAEILEAGGYTIDDIG